MNSKYCKATPKRLHEQITNDLLKNKFPEYLGDVFLEYRKGNANLIFTTTRTILAIPLARISHRSAKRGRADAPKY